MELYRCCWRILEPKGVGDKLEILLTDVAVLSPTSASQAKIPTIPLSTFSNCQEYYKNMYIANIIMTPTSLLPYNEAKRIANKTWLNVSEHFLSADSSLSMDKLSWEMNRFFLFRMKKKHEIKSWNKGGNPVLTK